MRKVLFATPAYDGRVSVEYAFCMLETVRLARENNMAIYPVFIPHDALIQRARNEFVSMALSAECDDLIFMDGDQEWGPSGIIRLLEHPVDVVGCAVPKKSEDLNFNVCKIEGETINEQGLLAVKSVGTGCLRISRKALTLLWEASEPYATGAVSGRMLFEVKVIDGELYSEDSVFCAKWRNFGGEVYVDTEMTCSHIGTKKFDADFKKFYARILSLSQ